MRKTIIRSRKYLPLYQKANWQQFPDNCQVWDTFDSPPIMPGNEGKLLQSQGLPLLINRTYICVCD